MKVCRTCAHYRVAGNNCVRTMTFADGQQFASPRPALREIDERNPAWIKVKRKGGDICGKSLRHWSAR
jgi:hypothetical protein